MPPNRYQSLLRSVLAAAVGSCSTPVLASEPPPTPNPHGDPRFDDSGIDWIQLYSGEWLQGSLDGLELGDVSFESEEFDDLVFDFDDVEVIWAPTPTEWILSDQTRVIGPSKMIQDVVTVYTEDGIRTIAKQDIYQMVGGAGREKDYWSFDAYLGVSARWGNSPQFTGTGTLDLVRDDGKYIWDLRYIGNLGTAAGQAITNNHSGSTMFGIYVTNIVYIIPILGKGFRDPFTNIAARATAAAGVGAKHPVNKWFTYNMQALGAYQYQLSSEAPPDVDLDSHDAAVAVKLALEFDPTKDLEIDLAWQSTVIPTNLGLTNHNGIFSLSYDLSGALELTTKVIFDRIEQPPLNEDGTRPLSNDLQWTIGFSVNI